VPVHKLRYDAQGVCQVTQERQLVGAVQRLLKATDQERLSFIDHDRWIGYTAAAKALGQMELLLGKPNLTRPPNMLLTADTNNGKTTLVKRFEALHPPVDDPAAARAVRPVIRFDVPSTPNEDRFYNHLLQALGAVYKITDKPDKKLFQIRDLLHRVGLKVLVLDEINNSLAGTATARQQLLNAIKELSNMLQRPIVLTGTFDALAALRDDKQIQNRFPPRVLPKWQLDDEFLQLLASFEATLPLRRASGLASEQLAPLLLVMSAGLIGELSELLKLAARRAVESGKERVTRSLLLELDWIPPDRRDASASAAEAGLQHRLDYRALVAEVQRGGQDSGDDRPEATADD
jgi:Bacterial TniB protein